MLIGMSANAAIRIPSFVNIDITLFCCRLLYIVIKNTEYTDK
jgi:hypothetical protein